MPYEWDTMWRSPRSTCVAAAATVGHPYAHEMTIEPLCTQQDRSPAGATFIYGWPYGNLGESFRTDSVRAISPTKDERSK